MDKMSTEEYYAAINSKLHEIKQKRREEGTYDRAMSESYFDSLNKRKNNPQ